MILSLRCENYKCFADTGIIKLAPLTILAGENNSGKSSIIQALHLPAMTIESEDPRICLKLLHKDYDYGSFRDIIFQHDESKFITLSFGARFDITILHRGKLKPKTIDAMLKLTYGYLPKRKEIYITKFVLEDLEGESLHITPRKYSDSQNVIMRGHEDKASYLSRLIGRRGFMYRPKFDPYVAISRLEKHYGGKIARNVFNGLAHNYQIVRGFDDCFRKIQHIGPLRIPPSRSYLSSGEVASVFGRRGEFALQTYSALLQRGRKEDLKKIALINRELYRLGFIRHVDVERLGTRYYELWTEHAKSSFRANLADTGFGASQVLPVIISLFTSANGSTLLYEQPEIHLHPAAQAELGTVFANACSSEKCILIETHSESLILRIQTEVARGKLKPKDVQIYYIKPNKEGHEAIPIPLNEKGEFLEKWPKGFFEENYQESLKLFAARQEG